MLAYLIDPKLQRVHDIELRDKNMLQQMRQLIGADMLDWGLISDEHDYLWCDGKVLARGLPCFAFRLRGDGVNLGPYGGRCIILGNNGNGRARPPYIPLDMVRRDIDWLGEILPEVTWIDEKTTEGLMFLRSVVTYRRPS